MAGSTRAVGILCVCAIALCTGCRHNDLIPISGDVTYDQRPVVKGTIMFQPVDGQGPTAAAVIKDGKYAANVATGKKQVQIEGFNVLGQRHYVPNDPSSPMVDIQEQYLPERYNAASRLTREITRDVDTYDFALEK